ncbi:MAG: hypothetical protein AMJ93_15410 [Anaerolineae bacterium SM23_84]|nr:MAG: hypothetical protein AMJ93_15410 [Anaerolineae bacterium SM23_84]
MSAEQYIAEIRKLIDQVEQTQLDNIQQVAEWVAESIAKDRLVYVFGAGHSALLGMEVFARAGGLLQMQPILDAGLDFGSGARRQGGFERLPGYAKIVIEDYDIQPGDVVIVVSNSGRNPAPVEMALEAKERGARIVALTSMPHSTSVAANNPAGKRLFEVADLVLDSGCPAGDAVVKLEGLRPAVAPSSTVVGALILNAIVAQAAQNLLDRGETPAVALSGNLEGAREYNERVLGSIREKFRGRMKHF